MKEVNLSARVQPTQSVRPRLTIDTKVNPLCRVRPTDMSSLSQGLREMQTPIDVEVADLSHLTLEALAHETVTFGQKHAGHLFSEARKD